METESKLTLMKDGAREYGLELEGEWTATRRLSLQLETQAEWERGVRAWSSNDAFRPTGPGGWAISTTQGAPDQLAPADYRPLATSGRLDAVLADPEPYAGTDAFYRSVYDHPLGGQLGDTFGLFPNNTVLVKLEYTFLR